MNNKKLRNILNEYIIIPVIYIYILYWTIFFQLLIVYPGKMWLYLVNSHKHPFSRKTLIITVEREKIEQMSAQS